MKAQLLRGCKQPDAAVVGGSTLLQESNRLQSRDEMIHLPVARVAENGQLPLESSHREPGLASGRILRGLDNRDAMKDEKTSRLKAADEPGKDRLGTGQESFKIRGALPAGGGGSISHRISIAMGTTRRSSSSRSTATPRQIHNLFAEAIYAMFP